MMQLLFLLCSIIYNSITSLLLSLLHLLRRRIFTPLAVPHGHDEFISLYEGTVWHERRRPVHHSFQYPVRYALIDLDQAANVPPNHLSGDEARRICKTNGPVLLFFSLLQYLHFFSWNMQFCSVGPLNVSICQQISLLLFKGSIFLGTIWPTISSIWAISYLVFVCI